MSTTEAPSLKELVLEPMERRLIRLQNAVRAGRYSPSRGLEIYNLEQAIDRWRREHPEEP